MLLEATREVLTRAVQYAGVGAGGGADGSAARVYADQAPRAAEALAPRPAAGFWLLIQDIQHPWVVIPWPDDLPIPPGWLSLGVRLQTRAPQDIGPGGQGTITILDESGPWFGPVRHTAQAAAEAAALRSLREELAELRRLPGRERLAARLTPGAGAGPFGRPSRVSRGPRAARRSRIPRTPRRPRVPGTKNARPPRDRTCRHFNSLGQCAEGCVPAAHIPLPNVGHSTCNWGPVDSCGNCVTDQCNGPAAFLLKPFLALLPKYWSAQSVAASQAERQAVKQGKRGGIIFARLPERTPGAAQVPGPAFQPDPRAQAGGCMCQDWPGYVICPNCSGGPKCQCKGACIAFPASAGNC